LPNKVFKYGTEEYVDYKVVSARGIDEGTMEDEKYLNDGNLQTGFFFDSYSSDEKEIIVDTGEI